MDLLWKVKNTLKEYKTIGELKTGVLTGSYTDNNPDFSRCFLWKAVFLLQTLEIPEWEKNLDASRSTYSFLSKQYRPPFSLLDSQSPYFEKPRMEAIEQKPQSSPPRTVNPNKKSNLLKRSSLDKSASSLSTAESPLSVPSGSNTSLRTSSISSAVTPLNGESSTTDSDVNELNAIIIDIERTFPGHPLFRDPEIKKGIVRVLFVWYKLNQDVGYRQGMHEIISTIFMVVHAESFAKPLNGFSDDNDSQIFEIFNQNEIYADVFHMFTIFMINPQASFYSEANLLDNCAKFDQLLHDFDYDLYYYLNRKLKLESQIWLIRWLRLMLIRELTLSTVLPIWDKLISFQKIKNFSNLTSNSDFNTIVSIIVLLLLLNIKKELLLGCQDYGDVLKLLLNYPVAKVFKNKSLTKDFDDDFNLAEVEIDDHVMEFINSLFNEAVLVFNSRRNLKAIGKFLNEKYNAEFINLYQERKGPAETTFIEDDEVLDKLRFQNRLTERVRNALNNKK
ncbi:hypothetical protein DASC09_001410 [Saccharomycopsis crataegensis]|uniref:Rab-GAP TBC domain-containing protein n=1 Tax=Saccharomycopsis crataegensis TaxID=43959 RepID=A0AAV5QDT8_9ASCO|nr:hypothetical protein DASC09_001410 [Saccharomycopsis crataegensis]